MGSILPLLLPTWIQKRPSFQYNIIPFFPEPFDKDPFTSLIYQATCGWKWSEAGVEYSTQDICHKFMAFRGALWHSSILRPLIKAQLVALLEACVAWPTGAPDNEGSIVRTHEILHITACMYGFVEDGLSGLRSGECRRVVLRKLRTLYSTLPDSHKIIDFETSLRLSTAKKTVEDC
jgi:hypothetical protein